MGGASAPAGGVMMNQFTINDVPSATRRLIEPVRHVRFPPQGKTSTVALIEREQHTVVLKWAAAAPFNIWLEQERRVLDALQSSGLSIPQVLHFERSGKHTWLLMSYLPGVPLSAVLSATHDPTTRTTLLERWGVALAALHRTPVPTILQKSRPWLDRVLDQAAYYLEHFPIDGSHALLDQLQRERPAPVPPTLIHGDFTADNTLVAADQIVGFVDWAGGACGDPRYDLALAVSDLPDHDDQAAFWRGYGGSRLSADEERYFVGIYEFF